MSTAATAVSPAKLLAAFSWWRRRRLRRSPECLDVRLRALFLFQWLALLVILAASLGVLFEFGPSLALEHPWAVTVVVLVAVGWHAWGLVALLRGEKHRYEDAPSELRGDLEPDEVEAIARTVGKRFGRREKPNVYVAIDKEANALAVNSMLLNRIPSFNAISLNSYLCRALSRDELRAILVHELAHFHRYMSPFARNAWLGALGSIAACVVMFAVDPEILEDPVLIAALPLWAPLPFLWLFRKIAGLGRRDLEYACDAVAAEVVGVEPTINALLKLGDRAEIFELVEQEMGRHLDEHPKAKGKAVEQALFDRIPEQPIDLEEARRLLRSEPLPRKGGSKITTRNLLDVVRAKHKLRTALKVVRWSRFDTIRRDGRLDRDELHGYVRSLTGDKNSATHAIASDHPKLERDGTHPSMRKRIVYLYLHFLAAPEA